MHKNIKFGLDMTLDETKSAIGKDAVFLLSTLASQGNYVFTYHEAKKILNKKRKLLPKILSDLVKKRWLKRLERGKYILLPLDSGPEGTYTEHEFIIASKLVGPYYISFWSAINYYGYTEQISNTVFIATTTRKNALKIGEIKFQFCRMNKKKFFGYRKEWIEGKVFLLAEKEKLVIDCLDRLEACGGIVEVVKLLLNAKDDISWDKLVTYGLKFGNKAVLQRLGFLLEHLKISPANIIGKLRQNISCSYATLDTLGLSSGRYINKWKIVLNIPLEDLKEWGSA